MERRVLERAIVGLCGVMAAIAVMPVARCLDIYWVQVFGLLTGEVMLALVLFGGLAFSVVCSRSARVLPGLLAVLAGPVVATGVQIAILSAAEVDQDGCIWKSRPLMGAWWVMAAGALAGTVATGLGVVGVTLFSRR